MKTVKNIVDEYKNRQETAEYSLIVVEDMKGKPLTFNDVRNFQTVYDKGTGRWLEFDSVYESKSRHVKIKGHVIQYIELLTGEEEESMFIAKDCVSVTIYTNSGKREDYLDVTNLTASMKGRSVEFDRVVDGCKTHVWRSGAIEKYEERINDTNN